MSKEKLNVCVDFDGVLNNYKGWKGEEELFNPRKNTKKFLQELEQEYNVIIFTTRDEDNIKQWLDLYGMPYDKITNIKEGAVAYIDDRALKFNGSYEDCLKELKNFKAYWEDDNVLKSTKKEEKKFKQGHITYERFTKEDIANGYLIKDNHINGLSSITLQNSDEAFLLCLFLNKLYDKCQKLEQENNNLKVQIKEG